MDFYLNQHMILLIGGILKVVILLEDGGHLSNAEWLRAGTTGYS